ncbi:bifunctional riboflavin kinase/FAD synthetase [Candidatus Liberibacter americanus]|uniref:Riboflavin biosynthesis protein n=1 Tax=Candidatus Liberibacter americanus str. Sao Paulo TaxID=1261131 RepID=U6B7R8_9HYPH|nr:bifunctional riboflavin kinase/FAD synthetase [Candidatus Liberibacter americanus]AHA27906.1 FAD synthase [Candidatus Liberibacter americanus str. Sao Paulo]EMS36095.1 bifunctional riboflavin kinase/FMN adenylyltransferase [Candidatus Liberibacter americanus PW_SP]
MKVFHNIDINNPLPEQLKGCVVAIGNFDGIHLGHRSIFEYSIKIAKDLPAVILLFDPHPKAILDPSASIFTLTPRSIQEKISEYMGFSALIRYKFTSEVADYSAEQFIQQVLVKWLRAKQVVTGSKFRFGKNRTGDGNFLKKSGERYGFNTVLVDEIYDSSSKIISSTRIRNSLKEGHVDQAAKLLGYHFTVESKVVHGKKLGRRLGYPTANMNLKSGIDLKEGVYTIHFRTQDKRSHRGIANFGRNPTITKGGSLHLESFIFNFSQEIYGEICCVSFFDFIRPEIKFKDLQELIDYIQKDERKARNMLAKKRPISEIDRLICF